MIGRLVRTALLAAGTAALCAQPVLAQAADGAAAPPPVAAALPAIYQPQDALERGLWLRMDEYERDLRTSQQVIHDPALNAYVRRVLCRTVGEAECQGIRLYITHTPYFNASMAPNGMMQVWSGLLLRIQNEAQLAAVLGHEYAHFNQRHSVQLFRAAKEKSNAAAWLAFTGLGLIAGLALVNSLFAFSRENEEEADLLGLAMMARAGYDTREAAVIWEQLLDEDDATRLGRGKKVRSRKRGAGMFATHPTQQARVDYLKAEAGRQPGTPGAHDGPAYRDAMRPWFPVFVDDQMKMNDDGATGFLLEAMAAQAGWTPWLTYARAEQARRRADPASLGAAVEDYSAAIAAGADLPELWRGRGLSLRKLGRADEAKADLTEYLARAPDAPDRAMIAMLAGGTP